MDGRRRDAKVPIQLQASSSMFIEHESWFCHGIRRKSFGVSHAVAFVFSQSICPSQTCLKLPRILNQKKSVICQAISGVVSLSWSEDTIVIAAVSPVACRCSRA